MWIDLKEKANKKLPAITSIFIILSAATIVFYMIFSIIPGYISIKKIRQDIALASTNIDLLNKIIPAFTKAKKFNAFKFEPGLPFPDKEKLDRKNLPELLNRFKQSAFKHKLDISKNKMDINFSNNGSDSLSVYLELKGGGRLPEFRNFLISLISLPFFETIEKVTIHTDNSEFNIFSVNLNVNIENKHE